MSRKLGSASAVRARRHRTLYRYLDRPWCAATDSKVYVLEWEANDLIHQLDLDYSRHLLSEFDRGHYGDFVMPFETELDLTDFDRLPNWDPFNASPRVFNGAAS